jgi:ubiquinone/menaquinone biosynthesis C-methylase UbiE
LISKKTGAMVVGIDTNPSTAVFRVARWRNKDCQVEFARMSGTELGFLPHSFDCVVVSHVIEHFKDPTPLLREAARVLKPDAQMIVVVPKEDFQGQLSQDHQLWFPTIAELVKVIVPSGLTALRMIELDRAFIAQCTIVD